MFPQTLRWRIQIWHGFLLAAVLTGFAVATYRYQAASERHRVDVELQQRVRVLADALHGPRGPIGPPPGENARREFYLPPARAAMFEQKDGAGLYFVVWRRDGSEWSRSMGAPADVGVPSRPAANVPKQGERTRGWLREAFTFTPPGECLLVGRSIAGELAALREYGRWLAAISGAVLCVGLAVGWWIARRATRPVGIIISTARRIAQGELSERIPVREKNSELGRLSTALNETFAQLEESFARQSRFTADAAHELRTPVAIILAQAQRALTRERDAATYRQTLEACVDGARRLNRLTESLLELAIYDAEAEALNLGMCDLGGIARETAAALEPLASERQIALSYDLSLAPCRADSGRIAQVILNCLTNALDHTPAGGRITLRSGVETDQAIFSISDTGCGIGPEHLPRLFDRFYRADDSRDRHTGGAGLGLAICKAIADAHHAKLEVASTPGQGSTFTLRIPVTGVREEPPAAMAANSLVL